MGAGSRVHWFIEVPGDGVDRGYFRPSEIEPLVILAWRASAATTKWIRYLKTARAPEP